MDDQIRLDQIRAILPGASRLAEIRPVQPMPKESGERITEEMQSFGEMLKESISEVNHLRVEADKAIETLATGQSGDIQGTILAMEKADMSFKLMMEVRNKIVSAYQEIMRTQV